MKYSIFFILLIFSFFWTKTVPCSFADEKKNKEEVIVIDEIILSTEDLEDDAEDTNKINDVDKAGELEYAEDVSEYDEIDENITESLEQMEQQKAEKNDVITNSSNAIPPQSKPIISKDDTNSASSGNNIINSTLDYNEGNLYEARKALSTSFFSATSGNEQSKIKAQLDEINRKLVFSQAPSPDSFFYTVKGGDALSKIAGKFNTTYEMIMLTNNKYRTDIRVGERLKIIKGTFNILVDKSDFTLTVLLNNDYIKQYKVGTGKDDKTPLGDFEIAEKMKEPTWYADDGIYEFGHPKNVLGTRWIGFKDKPGIYGYGIHGTADPDSIGKMESNGCIRLKNEDVEELYSFVTESTKVVIQK